MKPFKPGDHAIYVGPNADAAGKTVELICGVTTRCHQVTSGLWFRGNTTYKRWEVRVLSGPVRIKKVNGDIAYSAYGVAKEINLIPLNPPEELIKETHRERDLVHS